MDPVYSYFSENLAIVSKEGLLKALENALLSADYWRATCLSGCFPTQTRSGGVVGIESYLHNTEKDPRFHGYNNGAQVRAKI